MSSLLRGFSLLLLPLCGWLAGDAVQAKTTLHLAALQRTIELLQRVRQEIQYRRADLQSLYRQLCREGVLAQTHDGTLQQLPAPGQLSATERACFTECFGGLGRAETAQECERLDYYTARFEDYLQQARRAAQRQAGLPHRLGLAGGMMLALLFLYGLYGTKDNRMDIELVFKIAAIGIIVAVLNQLLIRSGREDQAMMTTLAGLVVVLSILVKQISTLFATIRSLFAL